MFAIPAFVTLYGSRVGGGLSELTDDVPMIDEPGAMWGTAAFTRWNIALRFTAMVRSHSSSGMSRIDSCVHCTAALLTRTSTRPNSDTACSMRARQCAGSARSPGARTARRSASRTSRAVSSASSCSSRQPMTTSAPSRAKARATAFPMPESAPVMTAILPARRSEPR